MYQLVVQLKDVDIPGNQVIHQIDSAHVASIQEAFESFDGKEAFQCYLEIVEEIAKDINRVLNKSL